EPAVDEDQPRAAIAQLRGGRRGDDRTESEPGEDQAVAGAAGQLARALRDGDDIARKHIEVVGAGRGRSVRQPMAAEVHRDGSEGNSQAPRDRRPRPRASGQTVDEDCARSALARPVEKVDAVARLDEDDVARWLEGGV